MMQNIFYGSLIFIAVLTAQGGVKSSIDIDLPISNNNELICGTWVLIKTSDYSEKTIFRGESGTTLEINCASEFWSMTENGDVFSSGTYRVKESTIEFAPNGSNDLAAAKLIDGDTLVVSCLGVIHQYVRK